MPSSRRLLLCCLYAVTLLLPGVAAPAGDEAGAAGEVDGDVTGGSSRVEWLYELDAYYSSVALQLPLTSDAIPDGGALRERHVYRQLFRDSLRPRVFVLEASAYPMPVFGTWLKGNHPDVYDDFDIGEVGANSLNIMDGLTAGFQEPWAVSAFVGSAMEFSRPGEVASAANRGYMGYLVSGGKKHIRNNVLIDDDWYELEWKLKGERAFAEEKLSWSFRLGARQHGNAEILDVYYIGLRRSNIDYAGPLWKLVQNSSVELLTEFDQDRMRFLRQEFTVGKKLPLRHYRVALALDVGFVYEDAAKYIGSLADPDVDALTFVFRPNIDF